MNALLGKLSCALFFLLAFAFSSFAQTSSLENYSAQFTIVKDTVLVEETFIFPSPQISFSWILPSDAEAVEVSSGEFQLQEHQEQQNLRVTGNLTTFTLQYLTESLIEKTEDRFFLVDLSGVATEKISVTLLLPEGATLKYPLDSARVSVLPKTTKVTTDGKNIILRWDEKDLAQGKALMVIYQEARKSFGTEELLFFFAILILFFIGKKQLRRWLQEKDVQEVRREKEYLIGGAKQLQQGKPSLQKEKEEEKKSTEKPEERLKRELTRNLFEEERAIVEVLLDAKGHELWQKQLQLQTGISAVKLSRKLRNLEAKGLIEKIPYGNTNKIRVRVHE